MIKAMGRKKKSVIEAELVEKSKVIFDRSKYEIVEVQSFKGIKELLERPSYNFSGDLGQAISQYESKGKKISKIYHWVTASQIAIIGD